MRGLSRAIGGAKKDWGTRQWRTDGAPSDFQTQR